MENQALIAALEQARAALDAVEAAATQKRKSKLPNPLDDAENPAEEMAPNEESE